jgi:hypothetical protein
MAFKVHLPDGRNVNLMTKDEEEGGADLFISSGRNSDFEVFSSNIMRQKNTLIS